MSGISSRPKFDHILHDISHLDENEIKGTIILQVMLEYVLQAAENIDVQDVHKAMKTIPQGEELMPTIADKLRQEGRQEGRLEGRQEGRQEGRLEGKRIALMTLINRKFTLSAEEQSLINSVQDPNILDQAMEAVLFAQDKSEVLSLFR